MDAIANPANPNIVMRPRFIPPRILTPSLAKGRFVFGCEGSTSMLEPSASIGPTSVAIGTTDVALFNFLLHRLEREISFGRLTKVEALYAPILVIEFENDRIRLAAIDA